MFVELKILPLAFVPVDILFEKSNNNKKRINGFSSGQTVKLNNNESISTRILCKKNALSIDSTTIPRTLSLLDSSE